MYIKYVKSLKKHREIIIKLNALIQIRYYPTIITIKPFINNKPKEKELKKATKIHNKRRLLYRYSFTDLKKHSNRPIIRFP